MKPQRRAIGILNLNTVHDWLRNHSRVIGGQISFGSTMTNAEPDRNIKCFKATGITPGTANTDFTVSHNLGYVPITISGQDTTNGGVLYRSPATAWTKTAITLRCTTASAAYNLIVV